TVVMFRGEVVEVGDVGKIFASPSHPYTKALLSAVPAIGSMSGKTLPLRFPAVDKTPGAVTPPAGTANSLRQEQRPVLEVGRLTTRFDIRSKLLGRLSGRVHAVENVSFSLQPGETLALVGESGCGKSTTGRSILRFTDTVSGTVLVDGQEVSALAGADLRD